MMDKTKLQERISDELKDVELYRQMAQDCPDWRQVFNDIADDEEQHARVLEVVLHNMN